MPKQNNDPDKHVLSQRFERYRKAKGLSYREIGVVFGKTEAAIRLASKRHTINESFIRTLSKMFDINLTWALTGKGDMFNPNFVKATPKSEKTMDELIDEKVDDKIRNLRKEIILLKTRNIISKELGEL